MVLDPLLVDGNIPFQEIEPRIVQRRADPFRSQIHSENLPIGLFVQDPVDQVVSDETVNAQD